MNLLITDFQVIIKIYTLKYLMLKFYPIINYLFKFYELFNR